MNNIALKNVNIGYDKTLIQEVNLQIPAGKLIMLLGENGSGKSTLMKTLLKIIPPLKGEILYNQQPIQSYHAKAWTSVFAAVFSRMGQAPQIKVHELIQIGARKKDENLKNQIIQWLEMEALLSKYAHEVSDGQLQKIMIARALMQDTDFIFFDEPTAHLDFKNKTKVFSLLKDLVQKTGKTFIIITHEILQALTLADEVLLIQENRLYSGTAQEINKQFQLEKQIIKYTQHGS